MIIGILVFGNRSYSEKIPPMLAPEDMPGTSQSQADAKTEVIPLEQSEIIPDELKIKIENLVKKLGADELQQRESAFEELKQIGRKSLPVIKKSLNDSDPQIRIAAERLYALIGFQIVPLESHSEIKATWEGCVFPKRRVRRKHATTTYLIRFDDAVVKLVDVHITGVASEIDDYSPYFKVVGLPPSESLKSRDELVTLISNALRLPQLHPDLALYAAVEILPLIDTKKAFLLLFDIYERKYGKPGENPGSLWGHGSFPAILRKMRKMSYVDRADHGTVLFITNWLRTYQTTNYYGEAAEHLYPMLMRMNDEQAMAAIQERVSQMDSFDVKYMGSLFNFRLLFELKVPAGKKLWQERYQRYFSAPRTLKDTYNLLDVFGKYAQDKNIRELLKDHPWFTVKDLEKQTVLLIDEVLNDKDFLQHINRDDGDSKTSTSKAFNYYLSWKSGRWRNLFILCEQFGVADQVAPLETWLAQLKALCWDDESVKNYVKTYTGSTTEKEYNKKKEQVISAMKKRLRENIGKDK
jgi:hypothetical protein